MFGIKRSASRSTLSRSFIARRWFSDSKGCPFVDIIKATTPVVALEVDEIVNNFYPRMFKNNPEVLAFFNQSNQLPGSRQRQALVNAVIAYATNIDNLGALAGAVEAIAHKHCALNIQPDHYPIVHGNLMESILHVIGSDVITEEIETAWSDAIMALAKILIDEEEKLYLLAESRQGGWRGKKEFTLIKKSIMSDDTMEFTWEASESPERMDFEPGQYLTIHLPGTTPRHYTITSPPNESFLQHCTRKDPVGVVSSMLHRLEVGSKCDLSPPFGVFTLASQSRVLISAGIGFTPMKTFYETDPSKVNCIIHFEHNEMRNAYKDVLKSAACPTYIHLDEISGIPDSKDLVKLCEPHFEDSGFYLCGPPAWMKSNVEALKKAGAENVHFEAFGPALA